MLDLILLDLVALNPVSLNIVKELRTTRPMRLLRLGPLKNIHAAELFVKRSPRNMRASELSLLEVPAIELTICIYRGAISSMTFIIYI